MGARDPHLAAAEDVLVLCLVRCDCHLFGEKRREHGVDLHPGVRRADADRIIAHRSSRGGLCRRRRQSTRWRTEQLFCTGCAAGVGRARRGSRGAAHARAVLWPTSRARAREQEPGGQFRRLRLLKHLHVGSTADLRRRACWNAPRGLRVLSSERQRLSGVCARVGARLVIVLHGRRGCDDGRDTGELYLSSLPR